MKVCWSYFIGPIPVPVPYDTNWKRFSRRKFSRIYLFFNGSARPKNMEPEERTWLIILCSAAWDAVAPLEGEPGTVEDLVQGNWNSNTVTLAGDQLVQ